MQDNSPEKTIDDLIKLGIKVYHDSEDDTDVFKAIYISEFRRNIENPFYNSFATACLAFNVTMTVKELNLRSEE